MKITEIGKFCTTDLQNLLQVTVNDTNLGNEDTHTQKKNKINVLLFFVWSTSKHDKRQELAVDILRNFHHSRILSSEGNAFFYPALHHLFLQSDLYPRNHQIHIDSGSFSPVVTVLIITFF